MPSHKKSHEHSARLKNPGKFASFTTGEDKGGKGVNFIYGIRKDAGPEGGKTEIQAIRFDSKLWSVDDAKKWLSDHDKKYIKFTAATIKEDEAPAGPAITTSNMGATYAPKVLPMASRYGDYAADKYDQSFMKKMKKSLSESVVAEGTKTRLGYEEYLNELGVPDDDLRSNGGRIPDGSKYGTWMRKNDPIAFNVGYREWVLSEAEKGKPPTNFKTQKEKDEYYAGMKQSYRQQLKRGVISQERYDKIMQRIESEEGQPIVAEGEPSIIPNAPSIAPDAPGKDLMIPRDMDSDLFDDYVRIYNSLPPEARETDEKLAELAAVIIKKYFGEKKVQWGSDGVEVMDDQLIFKNFSSSEDTSPEGGEELTEGVFHKAMTSSPAVSEGIRRTVKEHDIVQNEEGKKFRVYHINPNWAALIPVDTDDKEYSVSDKIMIPAGDLYEFYRLVRK